MKKVLNNIKTVFSIIIAIIAICMAIFTIISVNTFNRTDRSIFGYKAFIVLTDSMKATDFAAGDLVITKEATAKEIQEGDIITFISSDKDSYGEIFTHKVRRIYTENNDIKFITYGTTTNVDDRTPVSGNYNLIGKYSFSIPKVGNFFYFMKSTPGYICCILVPFIVLILLQAFDTIKLFRQYKKEQLDEINKEKESIIKQKEENEKILMELRELRNQLDNQKKDK